MIRVLLPAHLRTLAGVSKIAVSPSNDRPTEKASPPISGITANTLSSVMSSPMNTGMRPANGATVIKVRTASPLLVPARLSSSISLPGRISTSSFGNAALTSASSF